MQRSQYLTHDTPFEVAHARSPGAGHLLPRSIGCIVMVASFNYTFEMLSRKNLRLFRFVTERVEPTSTAGHARMRNGKSLVNEWNNAHPEWTYETSVGDLDARRAIV